MTRFSYGAVRVNVGDEAETVHKECLVAYMKTRQQAGQPASYTCPASIEELDICAVCGSLVAEPTELSRARSLKDRLVGKEPLPSHVVLLPESET